MDAMHEPYPSGRSPFKVRSQRRAGALRCSRPLGRGRATFWLVAIRSIAKTEHRLLAGPVGRHQRKHRRHGSLSLLGSALARH